MKFRQRRADGNLNILGTSYGIYNFGEDFTKSE